MKTDTAFDERDVVIYVCPFYFDVGRNLWFLSDHCQPDIFPLEAATQQHNKFNYCNGS